MKLSENDFIVNNFNGEYGCDQYSPAIAVDGNGNIGATWIDERNGNKTIYLQFYDSNYSKIGERYVINSGPIAPNNRPSIAANDLGEFVIVWAQDASQIYLQKFNVAFGRNGNLVRVNDTKGILGSIAYVEIDNSGKAVVNYSLYQNSKYQCYLVLINKSGLPSPPSLINDDGYGMHQNSYGNTVAIAENGDVYVTFTQSNNGIYDLYVKKYSNNIEKKVRINEENGNANFSPAISALRNGNICIAWETNENKICARLYDFKLMPISETITVFGNIDWSNLSITTDRDSIFYVTISGSSPVQVQKINGIRGEKIGGPIILKTNDGETIIVDFARLSNIQKDNLYLTYEKYDRNDKNIYLHKYNSQLEFETTIFSPLDDSGTSLQTKPKILKNSNGNTIVAWVDRRDGRNKMFYKIYDTDLNEVIEDSRLAGEDVYCYDEEFKIRTFNDGTFLIIFKGYSDSYSRLNLYGQKISESGERIGQAVNLYPYATSIGFQFNINNDDEIIIVYSARNGNYANMQTFDRSLEFKSKLYTLLETRTDISYNPLSFSINKNSKILASWFDYDPNGNNNFHYLSTRMFDIRGKALNNELKNEVRLSTNLVQNVDCYLDDYDNYCVLFNTNYYIHAFRKYGNEKPLLSKREVPSHNSKINIISYENKKIVSTITSDSLVYLIFNNDNDHTSAIDTIHKFIPFETTSSNKDYNHSSLCLSDNKFLIAYESNKHRGTGYDIWMGTRNSAFADTSAEYQFPLVNNDILFPISPNPANSMVNIRFRIFSFHNVKMELYNILGQKVKEIYNQNTEAGYYEFACNVSDLSSGVYFITMEAFRNSVQKFVIVK